MRPSSINEKNKKKEKEEKKKRKRKLSDEIGEYASLSQ